MSLGLDECSKPRKGRNPQRRAGGNCQALKCSKPRKGRNPQLKISLVITSKSRFVIPIFLKHPQDDPTSFCLKVRIRSRSLAASSNFKS